MDTFTETTKRGSYWNIKNVTAPSLDVPSSGGLKTVILGKSTCLLCVRVLSQKTETIMPDMARAPHRTSGNPTPPPRAVHSTEDVSSPNDKIKIKYHCQDIKLRKKKNIWQPQ